MLAAENPERGKRNTSKTHTQNLLRNQGVEKLNRRAAFGILARQRKAVYYLGFLYCRHSLPLHRD